MERKGHTQEAYLNLLPSENQQFQHRRLLAPPCAICLVLAIFVM